LDEHDAVALARPATALLSMALDGAVGLHAVPRDELPQTAESLGVDRSAARRAAERVGARFFVRGAIVRVGDRVRIGATLIDRLRNDAVVSRASAEGAAQNLFPVVDAVAAQLLAGRVQEQVIR
jgi:TolB-like protein